MARALIVGCGCRGRELGRELAARGWAVRGTSRSEPGLAQIEAAGIEPALADPARLGTILDLVTDVAAVLWLMGSAQGGEELLGEIHGARLEHLLERLVDTPVRGFVYEAAGTVPEPLLRAGREAVGAAARTWRIPVAVVEQGPDDREAWLKAALEATGGLFPAAGKSI